MKEYAIILLVGLFSLSCLAITNAATITVTNVQLSNNRDNDTAASDGGLIPRNTRAIGIDYLDISDDDERSEDTTVETLSAAFQQAGETSTFNRRRDCRASNSDDPGRFDFSANIEVVENDPLHGDNVYLIIGSEDCEDSFNEMKEVLLYKFETTQLFSEGATNHLAANSYRQKKTVAELLVSDIRYKSQQNDDGQLTLRLAAIPVPEPTGMSLLTLGGIALILRHRA